MRYLACRIDNNTGREILGSENQLFGEYANPTNFIKFGLKNAKPGQYKIYSWPTGTFNTTFICDAYVRV